MSINNADVIKLLRSDRSSDTRALLFYFIIIIIIFFFIFFFFFIIFFKFNFYFNLTVVRGRRSSEDGLKMEEKTQVPEVGFEPGTFRSCVDHSNHYATDTPPIPDVLLVLVAPKHIHRNVTTTLQSRFTPNPHPTGHTLELFFFFYFFYFFFFFLFFYFFVKLLNTSHCSPPPSSLSPPQPALFTATIFPISTPTRTLHRHHLPYLHPNPHCSPKFGLYPFFNIFLQNPYLLTWLIWGGGGGEIFGLYRFFNIFLQTPYLLTWLIWGRTFQPCILLMCLQYMILTFDPG